jgi:TP901 family phage tail tape measure protein
MGSSLGDLIIKLRVDGEKESVRKIDELIKKSQKAARIAELQTRRKALVEKNATRKSIDGKRKELREEKRLALALKKRIALLNKVQRVLTTGLATSLGVVSVALSRLAMSSFQVGKAFAQSLQTVKAITGETDSGNFKKLEDTVRSLGKTTSFTASEAANAMVLLARSGMETEKLLHATSASVYFAGGANASLESSTSLLIGTLNQFSLKAEQSTNVTDVFSVALKDSTFDMQSLTSAMRYGGSIGKAFGMSLEETTAALAQFKNLGLEGSTAGTQFRMSLSKAAKETNRGTEALRKYGLAYKDINPQLHSFRQIMDAVGKKHMDINDIITVFGVRSAGSIARISDQIASSGKEYDELLMKLRHATGATKLLYTEMQNTVEKQLDITKSAAQEFQITLFDQADDSIKSFLKSVTKALQGAATVTKVTSGNIKERFEDAFSSMSKAVIGQQKNISALGFEMSAVFSFFISKLAGWAPTLISSFRALVKVLGVVIKVTDALASMMYYLLGIIGTLGSSITWLAGGFRSSSREFGELESSADFLAKALLSLVFALTAFKTVMILSPILRSAQSAVIAFSGAIMTLNRATITATSTMALFRKASKGFLLVVQILAAAAVAFGVINSLWDENDEAISSAADAVARYTQLLNKLEEAQKRNFSFDQLKQVEGSKDLLKVLDKLIPRFNVLHASLRQSIFHTRDWTKEMMAAADKSAQLISLGGAGNEYFLPVKDVQETILALRHEEETLKGMIKDAAESMGQVAAEVATIELVNRVKAIREQLGEMDGALKAHTKDLEDTSLAYKTFKDIIEAFDAEMKSQGEDYEETSFIDLGNQLKEAQEGFKGLSKEQKIFLEITADGISSVENLKAALLGLSEASMEADERLAGSNASVQKAIDDAVDRINKANEKKTGGKGKKGKSQAQRLLEARLKLIEKINRAERDINSSTSEQAKNKLADQLSNLKKHFDKELKLYRNNAKKKNEIRKVQAELESKLINNALTEELEDYSKYSFELSKKAKNRDNDALKDMEEKHRNEIKALGEKTQSIKNLQGDLDSWLERRMKNFRGSEKRIEKKRSQLTKMYFDRRATNAKQLGSILNELEEKGFVNTNKRLLFLNDELKITKDASKRFTDIATKKAVELRKLLDLKNKETKLAKELAESTADFMDKEKPSDKEVDSFTVNQNRITTALRENNDAISSQNKIVNNLKTEYADLADKQKSLTDQQARDLPKQESLVQVINEIIKHQGVIETANNSKRVISKEKFYARLQALGLENSDILLLQEKLNMTRRETLSTEEEEARTKLRNNQAAEKAKFKQKMIKEEEQFFDNLKNKEKSLYDVLLNQRDVYLEQIKDQDAGRVDRLRKLFDGIIPSMIKKSLEKELNLYGDYTDLILKLEQESFDSKFSGDKLRKQESFNSKRKDIEISYNKKLADISKNREEEEKKFSLLSDVTNFFKKQKLLERFDQQELNTRKMMNAELSQLDSEQLKSKWEFFKKVVGYAKTAANLIKGMWSKVFSVIGDIANKALDTFSQLTGFSFDFSSGLSDVISQMKELDESELTQGVIEGRLSPEMAQEAREGQATDPKSAARGFIDNLISESVLFIDTFADAGPELIKRLGQKLPELTAKLAQQLPIAIRGFAQAMPILLDGITTVAMQFLTIIVDNLPSLVTSIVDVLTTKLPEIVSKLSESLPILARSLLSAVVNVLPILMKGLIELLPELILITVDAIVQLIPLIINAFVIELIPKLPEIIGILVVGIAKGLYVLILSLFKGIGDLLQLDTSGLNSAIVESGGASYQSPTGFHSGIPYVPQTMLARLHQGEAVIPSDVNARRQHPQNPAMAGVGAIGARMNASPPQPIDIAVMAEGKLLDAVQVLAMDRGHAPKLNKKFRRASGVKVGFSRGKYSKYSN